MDLCDISQIRGLLDRHGFRFSKSMGQNFLVASWVPERIAEESGLDENTGVLEVGPGIGCLTEKLSDRAGKVLSVELDKALKPVLAETLAGRDNVEIVFADLLKLDIPELISEKLGGLRPVVCANLPYNITSPLISAFIDSGCFETMTLMVQREVARRICAKPGTADYGAFSVYVNWFTEPKILFDVSPGCFVPQPKVTSSVIKLTTRQERPAPVEDEKLFFRIVRGAFNQRRKTLSNALSSSMGECGKDKTEQAIAACGLDVKIRGEALSTEQFAALTNEFKRIL